MKYVMALMDTLRVARDATKESQNDAGTVRAWTMMQVAVAGGPLLTDRVLRLTLI